jgi:hypothetical protein
MAARRSFSSYRLLVFFGTVWALASMILLVDSNLFSQRERFEESDFIMTFYVAGRLAATGRARELYPPPDARSYTGTDFDKAAHEFLPHLPTNSTGAYMYIPLVAGFFAPFTSVGPHLALLFWQALSVAALALCAALLARLSAVKPSEVFFLSFLFGPVFLTLWAGQLGLGFGLLPLCLGYFLLMRHRPLAAGIVWSFLLLKPQYFFAAAFVGLVCAVAGRYRILLGMSGGIVGLILLTLVMFSWPVTTQWLLSHRVADAYFFSGLHGIPSHLLTGLPANLLILFPVEQRGWIKLPLYAAAAALWLFGLWFCLRFNKTRIDEPARLSIAFLIGLVLSALTLPHLLYYDLCVLLPAGVLLLAERGPLPRQPGLRKIGASAWLLVSASLPLLLIFANRKVPPLLLELILLFLAILLWKDFKRCLHSPLATN